MDTGVAEDTKKTRQAFYTPVAVAARVVELAEVSGHKVLEPSCGDGALVEECLAQGATEVVAQELDPETAANTRARFAARHSPVTVQEGDFLAAHPAPLFPRICANPPFTRGQDLKHLAHMLQFLAPGGICVCIMAPLSPSKPAFLKATAGYKVTVEDVPAGAFKESGTNIATVIVKIVK